MHTCQNYKNKHKIEEFIQWPKKHSSVCYVNHNYWQDTKQLWGSSTKQYW